MARMANAISVIVVIALAALVVAFAGVRLVGLTPYAVLSGSMEPQFPVGSLIYVRAVDPATIKVGDAVTFRKGADVIATHQAYEVDTENALIRTQGIANKNPDGSIMQDAEPVPFSDVIGVPVACIPYLGFVNTFVTSVPGMIVVAAVAVAAVAATFVASALERDREEARPAGGAHMRRQSARPAARARRSKTVWTENLWLEELYGRKEDQAQGSHRRTRRAGACPCGRRHRRMADGARSADE